MKKLLLIFVMCIASFANAQIELKKYFKFATFYGAVNGGTSISDVDVFSVDNGLETSTIQTPFDYNVAFGIRKIARFGYENRANTFYDGTESSFSDAATVGKIRGLEFLFEVDMKRQRGIEYLDQHHFIRYAAHDNCNKLICARHFAFKVEYLKDGFADIEYYEASQRYRHKINNKLSINFGAAQRIAEPYGYDPLEEWILDNGDIHYTYLAIQEGYNIDVYNSEYFDPEGNLVANSKEVWESVIIPDILAEYVEKKRNELPAEWNHSFVLGFDYYHYTKSFWLHSWANLLPWHYDAGGQYSYHKYNKGEQWYDYSGGLIFGYKLNKNLGLFVEGKYNKYWTKEWYDFKCGINYVIF